MPKMKLELQVPSRQLSQRIKELGVKQDSLLYWIVPCHPEHVKWRGSLNKPWKIVPWVKNMETKKDGLICSAFSVAELGEILKESGYVWSAYHSGSWTCVFEEDDGCGRCQMKYRESGDTEADARAKILIYLVENKLIKL